MTDLTTLTDYEDGVGPRRVAWDTETHLIGDCPCGKHHGLAPPVVCLTVATEDGATIFTGDSMREAFRRFMGSCDVMVAHNLGFDLFVALEAGWLTVEEAIVMVEAGVFRDTMVREKLIAVALGRAKFDDRFTPPRPAKFNLATLAAAYLGKDRSAQKEGPDIWRLRYHELDGVPLEDWPQEAIDYALEDASDTLDIFNKQAEPKHLPQGVVVFDNGNVRNERAQTQAAVFLHDMANNGPVADGESVRTWAKSLQAKFDASRAAARDIGILRINKCKACEGTGLVGEVPDLDGCFTCGGDPGYLPPRARVPHGEPTLHRGRLQAWVRAALGDYTPMTDPSSKFPAGQVKSDETTLRLTGLGPLVEYADGLTAQKMISTYVPTLERAAKHPLISSPNVLVRTGRTSWSGPNLQNPPKEEGFRECFVARPGRVYCSVDYNMVEMVTLAQTCLDWFGESPMADAINAGQDLHTLFAAEELLHVSYDEALAMKAAHDPTFGKARQDAKIVNFGRPGGLGAKTLIEYAAAFGVDMDLDYAAMLINRYDTRWGMGRYFEFISSQGEDQGVLDANGTLRWTIAQEGTKRLRGRTHFTAACNTQFQGRAADLIKYAGWELFKVIAEDEDFAGVKPWVMIHDEIIVEGPEETAHRWAPEMARIMVEAGQVFVPDVKLNAEPALMRRWSKKAEPAFNAEGHLIPWEDQ